MTPQDETTRTATARPALRRCREPKKIAGVCSGFARYTGIDPVLIRVALVVLAVFGGAGAVIYLAAWLFLPEDGDAVSPVESLLGRGRSSTSAGLAVVLVVLGALAVTTTLHGQEGVLLILAVVAGAYLLRHPRRPAVGGAPPATAAADLPTARAGEPAATSPTTTRAGDPNAAPPGAIRAGDPTGASPTEPLPLPPAYAPHGPFVDSYGLPFPDPAPLPVPRPPRQRSRLGFTVVSLLLVVLGAMAALDSLGWAAIGAATYLAAALTVVAGGLLVGAWYGRSRSLIALGMLLSLALGAATAVGHVTHDGTRFTTQVWKPRTVAAIQPAYELGGGNATLDLRGIDFTDATRTVSVHVGLGPVTVRLPPKVDTTVQASNRVGNIDLFGRQNAGTDRHETASDLGTDGPGGGTLRLLISNSIGNVEVTRG